MSGALTLLERAALDQFSITYGGDVTGLTAQLQLAKLVSRENTGGGFFTDLTIDRGVAPPVACRSPLDNLMVRVAGMAGEMELLLFFQEGYAYLLEAYSIEGEDTTCIDFESAPFQPMTVRSPPRAI